MKIISTNCSGSWMYNLANSKYMVPFVSGVTPYESMLNLLTSYDDINWDNVTLEKSHSRPNTFIVKIDDKIRIHHVHYFFKANANEVQYEYHTDDTGVKRKAEVFYNRIWEYIIEKYKVRVKRMLENKEEPVFLIMEEKFANENSKVSLKDLLTCECKYKRVFITTDKTLHSDNPRIKIIKVDRIELPQPTIRKYFNEICEFCK